jgi:hypothetical protein
VRSLLLHVHDDLHRLGPHRYGRFLAHSEALPVKDQCQEIQCVFNFSIHPALEVAPNLGPLFALTGPAFALTTPLIIGPAVHQRRPGIWPVGSVSDDGPAGGGRRAGAAAFAEGDVGRRGPGPARAPPPQVARAKPSRGKEPRGLHDTRIHQRRRTVTGPCADLAQPRPTILAHPGPARGFIVRVPYFACVDGETAGKKS